MTGAMSLKVPRLARMFRRYGAERIMEEAPDVVIGSGDRPYMLRWHVIPRNRFCNLYLHRMLRSDDDRALHDHPWWSLSLVLRGPIVEVLLDGSLRTFWRGDVVLRRADFAHRLIMLHPDGAETLFLTGPKIREWGFHCPQGWRHWKVFDREGGCE